MKVKWNLSTLVNRELTSIHKSSCYILIFASTWFEFTATDFFNFGAVGRLSHNILCLIRYQSLWMRGSFISRYILVHHYFSVSLISFSRIQQLPTLPPLLFGAGLIMIRTSAHICTYYKHIQCLKTFAFNHSLMDPRAFTRNNY